MVVSTIYFLRSSEIEGISSLLAVSQRPPSAPCYMIPLYRAAPTVASDCPQREPERRPRQKPRYPCHLISKVSFPRGSDGKECACNAGDLGLIPGLGRSPGEGDSYPLQYSGLENPMDCIVYGVTKSWTSDQLCHI